MKREKNDKNHITEPHEDRIYTTIMVRHRTKIASGFIVKHASSGKIFIRGCKHEDNTVKHFRTPDMTVDELYKEWIVVDDFGDS